MVSSPSKKLESNVLPVMPRYVILSDFLDYLYHLGITFTGSLYVVNGHQVLGIDEDDYVCSCEEMLTDLTSCISISDYHGFFMVHGENNIV